MAQRYMRSGCVECHGQQGMGNGISRVRYQQLPDLLIEPHTVEHTPGDFYNWITYGMVDTDMPGYAENYRMKIAGTWSILFMPYREATRREFYRQKSYPIKHVKPPAFSYAGHDGSSGVLQDYRENKTVLLVIFLGRNPRHE